METTPWCYNIFDLLVVVAQLVLLMDALLSFFRHVEDLCVSI